MTKIYVSSSLLYYNSFKSGKRTVFSPCEYLKNVQKQILSFIKTVYKIRLNTKDAAKVHCNNKWLLKMDIQKFYESCSEELIKKAIDEMYKIVPFPKDFSKKHIYQICTLDNKLPAGAVTSAHLANIVFEITGIDDKLLEFCKVMKINYSRYMDDMFFSSESKSKLQAVERVAEDLLNEAGFTINKEKTKYISNNKPQKVLGLIVNNKNTVNIPQIKKQTYRALVFNYLKSVYIEERLGMNSLFEKKITLKEIIGYLSYIKASDEKFYKIIKEYTLSKITKFRISNNKEIKKLIKFLF